jgi:fatty acid desaturase
MTEQPARSIQVNTADSRRSGRTASVLRDAADMWRFAHRTGIAEQLKALHRPRLVLSLAAASSDWALIALATAAVGLHGWIAAPFSLLLIGNRQRALGNLLHDASHRNMDRHRARSAALANILFCWPLGVSMTVYREEHGRHHRFLGDPKRDPDYIHDETRQAQGWLQLWIDQILSRKTILAATLGHASRSDATSLGGIFGWWATALASLSLLTSPPTALLFLLLWFGAKATVFHVITAFREISDHVGLRPGTLIGFSRNHPFHSIASQIFHPHNNGYHLVHHLTPGIPFHAVPRAHALLMRWPEYARGEQCGSYFFGTTSAVRSWVRR